MNDNLADITISNIDDLKINTGSSWVGVSNVTTAVSNSNLTSATISIAKESLEDTLDKYMLNEFTIEHRVQEQEMLKLKQEFPDYADHIKENIAKNMARDLVKKIAFSKKKDIDADVHSFRGRVWVFTKEELLEFIKEVKKND